MLVWQRNNVPLGRVQYVSALRPPKLSRHSANEERGEAGGTGEDHHCHRRRVYTLTYERAAVDGSLARPRHSLHSQVSWSLEEELKQRRRLAEFHPSYAQPQKPDSDPEAGEAMEADGREWKQVGASPCGGVMLQKEEIDK